MSSFMMMSYGLTPIGVFPLALTADRIGAGPAILGACAILIVGVVAFYFLSSTLRNLDKSVENALA